MDGAATAGGCVHEEAPRYLIRDRDRVYGERFSRQARTLDIGEVVIAPRSPWQNRPAAPCSHRFCGATIPPAVRTKPMNRRAFVAGLGAVLAAPRATEAQQAGKVHHIGFLPAGASEAHRRQLEALREGLRELGYVPDKTLVITAVWPETPTEFPARPPPSSDRIRTSSSPRPLPPCWHSSP